MTGISVIPTGTATGDNVQEFRNNPVISAYERIRQDFCLKKQPVNDFLKKNRSQVVFLNNGLTIKGSDIPGPHQNDQDQGSDHKDGDQRHTDRQAFFRCMGG